MSDRLRNMSNLAQNKAEVSIIIPTYNESENIVQVLKSIGEHIPKDIATEAIVVMITLRMEREKLLKIT